MLFKTVLRNAVPFRNENVYISIGVATAPMHGMNLQVLYEKADKALYRAKLNGKNQYYIYAE